VDRSPEDPSPDDPESHEPEAGAPDDGAPESREPPPVDAATERLDPISADQPTTPYGPRSGEPSEAAPPGPAASPYTAPPIPPGPYSDTPAPYGVPPPYSPSQPPPGPPAAAPGAYDVWPADEASAAPKGVRPGLGAGLATGCGLQVLAVILFFVTAGIALGFFGALWPFILVTVGSALLMLSKRWRRFATGALIISAAAWITIIGPCVLILNGGFSNI
jgi:hypothetical protein